MKREIEITQTMIDLYGKINGDNDIIHYDHEYAVQRGFRGTLLHGPHMTAFAADLGAKKFGADWLYKGRLHTKWIGPACPGDLFVVELDDDGVISARVGEQATIAGSARLVD
jgi:acyl dehydratase